VRACRILLVVLLAGSTLAASPAAADLLRTDPNDYSLAPDIKSARSDVFRGTYSGHKTRIVRISLRFYDRIPGSASSYCKLRWTAREAARLTIRFNGFCRMESSLAGS
jgi:hypothetical protein